MFRILLICLGLYTWNVSLTNAKILSQWRGLNRDGIYLEKQLLQVWPEKGPEMLWSVDGLGQGFSSPAVTSKQIFVTGMIEETGYVFAFDHNGELNWKSSYGPEWTTNYPGARSTPTVVDDYLYIESGHGRLVCFDAKTGKIVWDVNLFERFDAENIRWGMAESVLVDGNRVICTPGGPKDNVVALDRFTGKTIWSSRGNGEQASYCSPQLFRQGTTRLIVTMTAKSIIGIDADTGEFYWRYPHTQRHDIHANTPVFSDGMVFCAGERKTGSIMLKLSKNGKQAKLAWHKPEFTNLMGGIVHLNGYIYGSIYRDRDWQCLNWETGEKQYSYTQLDEGIIIYADQRFYCYARDGQFALVNANSNAFEIKSSFQITLGNHQHWSHPVIHAQRLYIRHGDVLMVYSIARN